MQTVVIVILLPLVAASAHAADGGEAYSLTLAGKAFDERCLTLVEGASIRCRFRASAPVDFNIHYHRGKFYPVRRSAVGDAEGTFRAPSADDYCLMWEHSGPGTVVIEGTLERLPVQ